AGRSPAQIETAFPHPLTPIGSGAAAIASGDLDGDGTLDYVTANSTSGDVTAILGVAGGGLGATASFPMGAAAMALALADVNGDGALDVATANYTASNATIRLGTGSGSFGAASAVAIGVLPRAVALADLGADGHTDLVTFNQGPPSGVAVSAGDGAGHFSAATLFSADAFVYQGTLADVDGDGRIDAVTANYGSLSISVLPGTSAGGFREPIVTSTAPFHPFSLAVADVDASGTLDVVAGSYASPPGVSILLGDGAGHFFASGGTGDLQTAGVVVADLNGDARPDVLTSSINVGGATALVYLLPGDGNGGIGAPQTVLTPGSTQAIAATDLNGDGALDLVLASTSGFASTRLNDGAGAFPGPTTFEMGAPTAALFVADLDRDGRLDVVAPGYSPGAGAARLGDGAGGFGPATAIAGGGAFALGDLNGDSIPDLVGSDYALAKVSTQLGDGAGGFAAFASVSVASPAPSGALGDVDLDGDLDVLLPTGQQSSFALLLGDGAGGLAPPITTPSPIVSSVGTLSVRLGDLNGDGAPDRIVISGPSFVFQIGDGAGGFTTTASSSVPLLYFAGLSASALARVDGDGHADVVFTHATLFGTSTFAALGDGAGGIAGWLSLGAGSSGLALRDVDGDDDLDLVTVTASAGSLQVRAGNGTGAFGPPASFEMGPSPFGVRLEDLDGDGHLDAIAGSSNVTTFTAYRNLVADAPGLQDYGQGTPGCSGIQGIGGNGEPSIGNLGFRIVNTGAPPSTLGLLLVDSAPDVAGSDVFGFGLVTHVDFFASTFLVGIDMASDVDGYASGPAPIPNAPAFAGATLYAQGLWFWSACAPSPLHLSTSRGLAFTMQP
ncbi:MAG TPA: VCBS repeat-containing protein, partial [Planctomycetota bacterium]|nr:VCBS repeat-containing protein [Planctomycetota bacterium]